MRSYIFGSETDLSLHTCFSTVSHCENFGTEILNDVVVSAVERAAERGFAFCER